jgi:hypothetical protein
VNQLKLLSRVLAAVSFATVVFSVNSYASDESELQVKAPASLVQSAGQSDASLGNIQAEIQPTTWKSSIGSTFYDFTGTHPANKNAYSFGTAMVSIETFAIEDQLTANTKLQLRAQYLNNDYQLTAGSHFYHEQTAGIGDTLLGVTQSLYQSGHFKLLGDAGFYLPTGATDASNAYVANAHYKYFLQLGSGTVDDSLGLTALQTEKNFQMGARAAAILRNGQNSDDYRLGDWYMATAWVDAPIGYGFTPRLVTSYRLKNSIEGGDPTINRASAQFYYHDQIDWNFDAAMKYEYALRQTVSLNAEVGVPLAQGMQNYDNVVLSNNFYASLAVAGRF